MAFLDIFTGKRVETVGFLLATGAAAIALRGGHRIGVLVSLSIYLASRFLPGLFHFLDGFAEVPEWPNYVSLCVAALFAAHAGGWEAVAVIAGLAATGDGRMFDALY